MSMNSAAVNMRTAGCRGEYGQLRQGSSDREGLRRSCLFLFSRMSDYLFQSCFSEISLLFKLFKNISIRGL